MTIIYVCGVVAVLAAFTYSGLVKAVVVEGGNTTETARFKEISGAIREGAMAFLSRQYSIVGIFAVFFTVLIYLALSGTIPGVDAGLFSALAFIAGAATSTLCAFVG